jgi:hypothetical protein
MVRLRTSLRHVVAAALVLALVPTLWKTAMALSGGATPDKSNNPRKVGGIIQPAETCNRAGCHTTLPAAGCTGMVEILGLPGCYAAGQVYNLQIKVTDANATRWGFEVGAQYDEGNHHDYFSAGSIDNAAGARTQKVTSADGQRSFITHDPASAAGDGTYPGQAASATWDFKWTAPGIGDRQTRICFYVAGLAADNDEGRAGDCTYNTKVCINPCGPVDTKKSTWGDVKSQYNR